LDANTCMEQNANAREPKESHCYSHVHSLVPVLFELPRISPKFIETGKSPSESIFIPRPDADHD
ncbi:unnamed protein product, partial [Rotaria sordida]